ncbi:hypothetical protein M3661_29495 [Paenibacillus sp. MER 180]|uniref:hypothetical protein n=1 Tax=Paenibacillus sp. MER 180 TaxID=2939570 RepID=UPI00203D2AD2|nr:hypothetical protein [Paenibacillus sp. MER 180]MCM3294224.1 hypothetical protein [Paenibacillus sp. MER 180]
MSVNTKKLCQLLKYAASRTLIWSKLEDGHTITDRHFMVAFTEVPRDVMSVLLGIFLRIPEDGQSLKIMGGELQDDFSLLNHEGLAKYKDANVEGLVTPYLKDIDGVKARVLQIGDRFALVNDRFMGLTTDKVVRGYESPFMPIYLSSGAILVLPFRYSTGDVTQTELLKITTHFEYSIQV